MREIIFLTQRKTREENQLRLSNDAEHPIHGDRQVRTNLNWLLK